MLKYSVCVTPGCDARTPVSPICLACYHKALGLEMLQTQTAGCGLFAAISNVQEGDILLPYLGEVSRVDTANKSLTMMHRLVSFVVLPHQILHVTVIPSTAVDTKVLRIHHHHQQPLQRRNHLCTGFHALSKIGAFAGHRPQ